MKKIMFLLVAIVVIFSCSEKKENSLIGKWKLTEQMIGIGNGNATFQKVNSEKTIEFLKNGTLVSNGTLCTLSKDSDQAEEAIFSEIKNAIILKDCGSNNKDIYIEMKGAELILSYQCIEVCQQKYIKLQ
ncbi:MAG: hypothetical protein AB8F94_10165 [Saprospiraceae bacterium]